MWDCFGSYVTSSSVIVGLVHREVGWVPRTNFFEVEFRVSYLVPPIWTPENS